MGLAVSAASARGGSHGHVKADGQAGAGGGRATRNCRRLGRGRSRLMANMAQASISRAASCTAARMMIGGAATNVASEPGIDVGIARLVDLRQERDRRHDLSRLAVAALHDVELLPRRLNRFGGLA